VNDETKGMDRLTKQLYYIPTIIGKMGVSIAEAQKALNADYVHTVTQILRLLHVSTQGDPSTKNTPAPDWTVLSDVLKQLAPPRYQFTESTLEFGADLSESLDLAGGIGVGFGMAGITVNASFSMGYARDYRAAAKITSVLHAIPPDTTFGAKLLERAKEIESSNLPLPSNSVVEKVLWDEVAELRKTLTGKDMPAITMSLDKATIELKGVTSTTKVKVNVTRIGEFTDDVKIEYIGVPADITFAPASGAAVIQKGKVELEITITAGPNAIVGTKTVTIKGTSATVASKSSELTISFTK